MGHLADTGSQKLKLTGEVRIKRAMHLKGRTPRTEIMFHEGGRLYIYLIYGMYWMLNVVTGEENNPQAVLIRGVENFPGPGKITKALGIDRSFYGEDLVTSERIWFEDNGFIRKLKTAAGSE